MGGGSQSRAHCRRGKPAKRLSEGEKTAVAFIYFLVQLKDQDFNIGEGIVVIDDPISSLDASAIYVDFIAACQRAHLVPHYAVHITGHGWRKLMRLSEPFVYQITKVPQPPGVFEFMKSAGPIDVREAYATFNMGAGFAVYVDPHDVQQYLNLAQATGHQALLAGTVVKKADRKAVEILPLGLCFESETLAVR